MGNMVAAVAEDKWVLSTGENAVREAEIEAWVAARGDVVNLYAWWCNRRGFAPAGGREMQAAMDRKLDNLYALLMKVPWWSLTRAEDGPDGELRYINRDYYEDETNELNEIHRNKVEENVRDVYAAMDEIAREVATWVMDERGVAGEYEAVRRQAFAAVRVCLKIPDFRGRRRREETGGRKPGGRPARMCDSVYKRGGEVMMEADSRDFSALERQMEHISAKFAQHGQLVTSIGRVVEKVRGGRTGFTASEKKVIQEELRTAERCARQLYDSGLVKLEIACAQGLVEKAAVYAAPVEAKKEGGQVPYTIEDGWERGPVYEAGYEQWYSYEVRKYAADTPEGEYQLWCNNRRERDYTEDMKQKAAETQVAVRQAVKTEALLDALKTVGER